MLYTGGILAAGKHSPAECEILCQKQGLDKDATSSNPMLMGITAGDVCLCGYRRSATTPDFGKKLLFLYS